MPPSTKVNKLSDVNEEKKLFLKNGQTPGGGQSETSIPFNRRPLAVH
jgi:hypothetical protein